MEILNYHQNSIINRMNFNDDPDTIFLLEDYGTYDISYLKEIPSSKNVIIPFLSEIIVQYEYLLERKEKKCSIKELKKNFDFIKIIYETNKNEINFLVLKGKYSPDDILQKINEKAIFGNKIKKFLQINDFPLDNCKLKEDNFNNYGYFYDKIYRLKFEFNLNISSNKEEINVHSNININNNSNNNNNIIKNDSINININNDSNNDSINKLIEKKILLEERIRTFKKNIDNLINEKMNEFNEKLNFISFKIAEALYLENLKKNNNNINYDNNNNNFMKKTIKLKVFIYSKKENKYLSMTNEGKVIEKEKEEASPWDIEINFYDRKISFCSNKFYLTEKDGNGIGQKDISNWNFHIENKNSYYFIINNNLLSIQIPYIKIIDTFLGEKELFQLIGIFENNNIIHNDNNINNINKDNNNISNDNNINKDNDNNINYINNYNNNINNDNNINSYNNNINNNKNYFDSVNMHSVIKSESLSKF